MFGYHKDIVCHLINLHSALNMTTGEYLIVFIFFKLTLALIVVTYNIYLHKDTFSRNESKRRKAESNVRHAMNKASARVRSYGRPNASEDWSVVIL